jgi:hypothetical protein
MTKSERKIQDQPDILSNVIYQLFNFNKNQTYKRAILNIEEINKRHEERTKKWLEMYNSI